MATVCSMSRSPFRYPAHEQVVAILASLDSKFLSDAGCFFAGGTRIVLELGEYRQSKDVDFLCADKVGYRRLRETVSASSLGQICASDVKLAREIRADQYGIRTILQQQDTRLKFEIVREARIGIAGTSVPGIPVTCLDRAHCVAEKFLANADRGLDASTLSRDLVDLAFMIRAWSKADLDAGLQIATEAYGTTIGASLAASLQKVKDDRAYRSRCVEGLGIDNVPEMNAGLRALNVLVGR